MKEAGFQSVVALNLPPFRMWIDVEFGRAACWNLGFPSKAPMMGSCTGTGRPTWRAVTGRRDPVGPGHVAVDKVTECLWIPDVLVQWPVDEFEVAEFFFLQFRGQWPVNLSSTVGLLFW